MSNCKPCQLPEMYSTLASSGSYKENTLHWVASTTNIISHSSRGWDVQDRDTSGFGVCRMLASWLVVVFLQYPHMAEKVMELSRVSLIEALNSFMRAPPSQRPPLQKPSQNMNLGREIFSLQHMVRYLISLSQSHFSEGTS